VLGGGEYIRPALRPPGAARHRHLRLGRNRVRGDTVELLGEGRIAIYDNVKHGCCWYYWLAPTERFDLRSRHPIPT
jgi:hypothetical protein